MSDNLPFYLVLILTIFAIFVIFSVDRDEKAAEAYCAKKGMIYIRSDQFKTNYVCLVGEYVPK